MKGWGRAACLVAPFSSHPPLHPNGWDATKDIGPILDKAIWSYMCLKNLIEIKVRMFAWSNEDIKAHFSYIDLKPSYINYHLYLVHDALHIDFQPSKPLVGGWHPCPIRQKNRSVARLCHFPLISCMLWTVFSIYMLKHFTFLIQ